jgi:hypothetical protein
MGAKIANVFHTNKLCMLILTCNDHSELFMDRTKGFNIISVNNVG